MTRVHTALSDIFFNSHHEGDGDGDGTHTNLHQEASDLIESLQSLGVDTPTVEELIGDFIDRL